jgi:type I restriction enzyme S subunit
MKTPQLRFPEFSDEWKAKKIGDVLTIGSGRDYKHLGDGEVPVYGTGGLMTYVNDYLHEGKSIGIGRKGTINNPQFIQGKFWTVDTLFYTHSYHEAIPEFLYAIFQRINWLKHNEASGVPSLSKSTIEKICINIPSEPEQEEIADFLTIVDQRIELIGRRTALLRQYRRGVMQKIFSQQIRFRNGKGDEYPDWKRCNLGELLTLRSERNSNGDVHEVFSVAKHAGIINQIEHLGRSFAASSISDYKIVRPYDIVYTKSPTSDFPFGIIKQNKLNRSGVVSVLYGVYQPLNNNVGYLLDAYFSPWQNAYNYLNPIVQKGAKNTINIGDSAFLEGARIKFPVDEDEQQKIADFLLSIDANIKSEEARLASARKFKKALLQRMFV